LGRHWMVALASLALLAASGALFITRWARRGVFRALANDRTDPLAQGVV
jgi:hypothetical protein